MARLLVLPLLTIFCALIALPANAVPQDGSIQQSAEGLIERLGATEFLVREEATRSLWELGESARPDLERALFSRDREVVARVELILDRLRFGLTPNTSADVVGLIEQYRVGSAAMRKQVVKQLLAMKEVAVVERFLDMAENDGQLDTISNWILGSYSESLIAMLADGDEESVARLLTLTAGEPMEFSVAARILSHSGQLDLGIQLVEERAASRRQVSQEPVRSLYTEREQGLLVALYHAHGELDRAIELASELPNGAEMTRDILISRRRWNRLSQLEWERQQDWLLSDRATDVNEIEAESFAAVIHYFAGEEERCDQVVSRLLEALDGNATATKDVVECLFAVDRYDDGIDLLIRHRIGNGFALLCTQNRYEEAFQVYGLSTDAESILAWVKQVAIVENLNDSQGLVDLFRAIEVAGQLAILGERELSQECYRQLAEVGLQDDSPQFAILREVTRQQFLFGFEEDAWRQLEELFRFDRYRVSDPLRGDFGMRCLLPNDYLLAGFWWSRLAKFEPDSLARLKQIKALLESREVEANGNQAVQDRLEAASKSIEEMPEGQRYRSHLLLAETCERIGAVKLAIKHYRQAFEAGDAQSAVRLGDLFRKQGDWQEAGSWYGQGFEANPTNPVSLYLRGLTLAQEPGQSRSDEGRHFQRRAILISFLNPRTNSLADSLSMREMDARTEEIWQTMASADRPLSETYSNACGRLGNLLVEREPRAAAENWEQVYIGVMLAERGFVSDSSYLSQAELIHHARAREALENNQVDVAWRHIQFCRAAQPGSTRVAEDFVPWLEELQQTRLADELFDELYQHYLGILDSFPNSALHHNNLAWFSARCKRRLEDALQHAELAVQLEPTSPNYLDTLAEIAFLLGDVERAIELAKQCVDLNATKPHYQQQLQRFLEAR